MAAPCRSLLRSTREVKDGDIVQKLRVIWQALKSESNVWSEEMANQAGLQYMSSGKLCTKTSPAQSLTCFRPHRCVFQHRALHYSSSKTDAAKTTDPVNNSNDQEKKGEQDSGPEYIPKRKAKNPMKVIGYAWIIGLPSGIIGFILAKRQVDKNRLQQLKIRQRMKKSNEGEYEHERYKPAARMQ